MENNCGKTGVIVILAIAVSVVLIGITVEYSRYKTVKEYVSKGYSKEVITTAVKQEIVWVKKEK